MTPPRKALLFQRFVRFTPPLKRAVGCPQAMAEAFELPRRALPRPWMCACAHPRATMRSAVACSTSCCSGAPILRRRDFELSAEYPQHDSREA